MQNKGVNTMKKTLIIAGIMASAICVSFTSCGTKKADVSGGFELSFSGYDGYGTATLSDSYSWVDDVIQNYGTDLSGMELIAFDAALRSAVDYTITPNEAISNGDEITVSVDVDNSLLEEYKIELTGGTAAFIADGLDEIEEINPFDDITISYDDIAPRAKATIDTNSFDKSLVYTLDKDSGLSNGDIITVTVSPKSETMEEYIQKYGKKLAETEKTYTVEGLSTYASALDDIPQDTIDKMDKTFQEAYAAKIADLGTIEKMELLGNYVQTAKSSDTSPYNRFYFVYKVTADFSAEDAEVGVQEYYWCAYYENIIIMPDGTISADYEDLHMGSHNFDMLTVDVWYVEGCKDLETLYRYNVTERSGEYDCISTVK